MKTVDTGVLHIAYLEFGPPHGVPTVLLHGFPYDVHAYDDASRLLAETGHRCIVPYLRGYGPTRFLSMETLRSGEQAALGADLLALLDALSIEKAVLGGYDWGGRAACIVAALHPDRVHGLVSCGTGYNIQDIAAAAMPVAPEEEARYWYQYYFHSARGRTALETNRRDLCRYIWQLWSPSWRFTADVFERSATSFDNPDFADIVVHSYRHRFGGIPGDAAYAAIEARLARQPDIHIPTIVLQGADDGVDPPTRSDGDAKHFRNFYQRRAIPETGHNLPQEAPRDFADAIQYISRGFQRR